MSLMSYAIAKDPFSLQYAPQSMKENMDIVKLACSIVPSTIQFADESIRGNPDFIRSLLCKDGDLLEYLTRNIADDVEMVTLAMKKSSRPMMYASKRLRGNRIFVYSAVKKDWEALRYASHGIRNDMEIAKLAIRQNPDALDYIGKKVLKSCPEILDIAISATDGVISFYKCYFKFLSTDQIISALTLNPSSYERLPSNLQKDPDIVTTVLTQDWTLMSMMTHDISHRLRNVWTIIRHDDWYYVPPEPAVELMHLVEFMLPWNKFKNNRVLLIAGIKKDRRIIQHASPSNKGDPRLVIEAMKIYEDIGIGMIDPLSTAPYTWCNMKVLAKNLSNMGEDDDPRTNIMRNNYMAHLISRFSKVHLTKAIGVSRVYRILKQNVDLFHH
jgi:hypothetical protein